ncbi:MAG: o-succinylbenzoate synthase [Actinobacteria bacterium]|nr:o-succinylbenzoate synthase [Actinomycetota bacterium]
MRVPFRGVRKRTGLLLQGDCGWGEFSPFPDYGVAASARWLQGAYEAATRPWPQPVRATIPVNVTVPALAPADAHTLVAASGCSTAKVKVGDPDDEARVEAVRDALGPRGHIRIDVNGAWDVEQATRKLRALGRHGLEYVEQPVGSVEDMARLRRQVEVPIAADESIRLPGGPERVKSLCAADIVVLKVNPLGGVWRCLQIAEQTGLPAVASSALETSVGIAGGLALAAALPDLPYACGLATAALLEDDLVAHPLLPVDGTITLARPEPDPARLTRCSIPGGGERDELTARLRLAAKEIEAG